MKKVLIITYYWPPAGGPGVQRVLKFAKYLPEFGWQPIILTVQNGEYPAHDESLFADIPKECKVYKTPAIEPFSLYKKFTGMNSDEAIPVAILTEKKKNWKKKLAHWIRLNLFIPDAKIGWIPYAVKAGKHIIRNEKPDIIFSSSPPPTVHLIAKSLVLWSKIKWMADFRDPWTEIYHYDNLKQNKYSRFHDKILEKKVLEFADLLITVSKGFALLLKKKISNPQKINVISNGYDEEDFSYINSMQNFDKFVITYIGKMNDQQNPINLWTVLGNLVKKNKKFAENLELLFMGNIADAIWKKIYETEIDNNITHTQYINHRTALEKLMKSQILLLLIPDTKKNNGIVPGKIFEYLATKNFILGIGPKSGDAYRILNETKAGKMFEFNKIDGIKKEIERQYVNWQKGIKQKVNKEEIGKYSRRKLTEKLSKFFSEFILRSVF